MSLAAEVRRLRALARMQDREGASQCEVRARDAAKEARAGYVARRTVSERAQRSRGKAWREAQGARAEAFGSCVAQAEERAAKSAKPGADLRRARVRARVRAEGACDAQARTAAKGALAEYVERRAEAERAREEAAETFRRTRGTLGREREACRAEVTADVEKLRRAALSTAYSACPSSSARRSPGDTGGRLPPRRRRASSRRSRSVISAAPELLPVWHEVKGLIWKKWAEAKRGGVERRTLLETFQDYVHDNPRLVIEARERAAAAQEQKWWSEYEDFHKRRRS
jgi:hypothetical protein